jgi:hypothetical protein
MLTSWSMRLSCALTAAREAVRPDADLAYRVRLILTMAGTGPVRVTIGDDRLGTGTGFRFGCGSGGTLAALPMPLGSLTEPFSPRALAGPGGMPLTPASWAGDLPEAARRERMATIRSAARPHQKIEIRGARIIDE